MMQVFRACISLVVFTFILPGTFLAVFGDEQCVQTSSIQTFNAEELHRKFAPSVVRLAGSPMPREVCHGCVVDFSYIGTGFLVSDDLILTTYHEIETTDELRVHFYFVESPVSVRVVAVRREHDLALLKILGDLPEGVVPLEIGNSPLMGEFVGMIGMPVGGPWSWSTGYIQYTHRLVSEIQEHARFEYPYFKPDLALLQVSITSNVGSSGAPMFRLQTNTVGGMLTSGSGSTETDFFISAETIQAFLLYAESILS